MDNQLWNLFQETGDPMGYLLYKAGEKKKKTEPVGEKKKPQQENPAASM